MELGLPRAVDLSADVTVVDDRQFLPGADLVARPDPDLDDSTVGGEGQRSVGRRLDRPACGHRSRHLPPAHPHLGGRRPGRVGTGGEHGHAARHRGGGQRDGGDGACRPTADHPPGIQVNAHGCRSWRPFLTGDSAEARNYLTVRTPS